MVIAPCPDFLTLLIKTTADITPALRVFFAPAFPTRPKMRPLMLSTAHNSLLNGFIRLFS